MFWVYHGPSLGKNYPVMGKYVAAILNHFVQGYLVGNGVTDEEFDGNALVPFAHGMGLISNDLFEVHEACHSDKKHVHFSFLCFFFTCFFLCSESKEFIFYNLQVLDIF